MTLYKLRPLNLYWGLKIKSNNSLIEICYRHPLQMVFLLKLYILRLCSYNRNGQIVQSKKSQGYDREGANKCRLCQPEIEFNYHWVMNSTKHSCSKRAV